MMFPLYKIALTGSTGKTSSKELLAGILSEAGSTMKTLHNENNMVGLAKTILRVEAKHKYGVFELGTNHFGEIGRLSDICMPDSAIILNIGPSHLEFLIDEDGVFREKSALFNRSLQYRIYPQEDERFAVYKAQGLSVGRSEQADYCVSEIEITGCGTSFKINQYRFELPYNVPHYVTNASFGIAMALSLGLEPELIQAGLSRGIKLDKRMEIKKLGDALVIVDCYNANPVSMQKAIEYWISLEPSLPHKAILGDMLELGEQGDLYHQMIGAMLSELNYQALISVGELARHYAPESQSLEYLHFSRVEELAERVDLKSFCAGAVVLIKASHGIHLEKLLSQLGVEN